MPAVFRLLSDFFAARFLFVSRWFWSLLHSAHQHLPPRQADGSPGNPARFMVPSWLAPLFGPCSPLQPSPPPLSSPSKPNPQHHQRRTAKPSKSTTPASILRPIHSLASILRARGISTHSDNFLWSPVEKSVLHDVPLGRPRRFRRLLARLAVTSPSGHPQPLHRRAIDRVAIFSRFDRAIRPAIIQRVFPSIPRFDDDPISLGFTPVVGRPASPDPSSAGLDPSEHDGRFLCRPHHVFSSSSDSSDSISTIAWNL